MRLTRSHPRAFAAIIIVAAVGACAGLGGMRLGPAGQRTRMVEVEPGYVIGQHGETGLALRVVNRTNRPLRLEFHVTLPGAHPRQGLAAAAGGDGPDPSRAACEGIRGDTVVAGGGEARFASCTFQRLTPGAAYEAAIVVHDGDAGAVESLRFVFDLARAQRRLR